MVNLIKIKDKLYNIPLRHMFDNGNKTTGRGNMVTEDISLVPKSLTSNNFVDNCQILVGDNKCNFVDYNSLSDYEISYCIGKCFEYKKFIRTVEYFYTDNLGEELVFTDLESAKEFLYNDVDSDGLDNSVIKSRNVIRINRKYAFDLNMDYLDYDFSNKKYRKLMEYCAVYLEFLESNNCVGLWFNNENKPSFGVLFEGGSTMFKFFKGFKNYLLYVAVSETKKIEVSDKYYMRRKDRFDGLLPKYKNGIINNGIYIETIKNKSDEVTVFVGIGIVIILINDKYKLYHTSNYTYKYIMDIMEKFNLASCKELVAIQKIR